MNPFRIEFCLSLINNSSISFLPSIFRVKSGHTLTIQAPIRSSIRPSDPMMTDRIMSRHISHRSWPQHPGKRAASIKTANHQPADDSPIGLGHSGETHRNLVLTIGNKAENHKGPPNEPGKARAWETNREQNLPVSLFGDQQKPRVQGDAKEGNHSYGGNKKKNGRTMNWKDEDERKKLNHCENWNWYRMEVEIKFSCADRSTPGTCLGDPRLSWGYAIQRNIPWRLKTLGIMRIYFEFS